MPTGNRRGAWNLLLAENWRMTSRIDRDEIEIIDLDYEDFH
jgi:proteic killer suppression protein